MSKLIPIDTSMEAMELIKQLTAIALKAQGNSPSPVDIKQELAYMDAGLLMILHDDVSTAINERKTIYEQRGNHSKPEEHPN